MVTFEQASQEITEAVEGFTKNLDSPAQRDFAVLCAKLKQINQVFADAIGLIEPEAPAPATEPAQQ